MANMKDIPEHFKGKDAIGHVAEAKAQGLLSSAEVHGTEIPGHISAFADVARETAIVLLMLWTILTKFGFEHKHIAAIVSIFSLGWLIWKGGRSAWLGWSRLERMHRVVEQERWEIQHHRGQEREELKELYRAKGLEGKLLDDVIDVLMADEDRLLKVMVVEELCLSLETHEHPLKQAIGAILGVIAAFASCFALLLAFPHFGVWIGSVFTISVASFISARYEGNKVIPAVIWNLGITALTVGSVYFLLDYVKAI
jgi:hypothetical protein